MLLLLRLRLRLVLLAIVVEVVVVVNNRMFHPQSPPIQRPSIYPIRNVNGFNKSIWERMFRLWTRPRTDSDNPRRRRLDETRRTPTPREIWVRVRNQCFDFNGMIPMIPLIKRILCTLPSDPSRPRQQQRRRANGGLPIIPSLPRIVVEIHWNNPHPPPITTTTNAITIVRPFRSIQNPWIR